MLENPLFVSSSPINVKWEITKGCNLKCKHCYASAGLLAPNELTKEEALKVIDRLAEIGVISVQFTGGEPFIRKDFLEIIRYAKDYNFCITILTNGTLITKNLARTLATIDVHSIQVSLDGSTKESHEKIRGVKGSFNRTISGIKNLAEAGARFSIATTFSRINANEEKEILSLTRRLGAYSFLFGFVYPVGRGKENFKHLCLPWKEMRRIQRFLSKEAKNNPKFPIYIDESIGTLERNKWKPPVCKAGRIMITITAEGNITLCPMLPDIVLGNVRTNDIINIWQDSPYLIYIRKLSNIKGRCSTCGKLPRCGGGCRALSYLETGDLMGSDPFCPLQRKS